MNRFILYLLSGFAVLISGGFASAQTFFRKPPTNAWIHNPSSIERQRNRTTISIKVPENAGAELQSVVISQLTNIDVWDWGHKDPEIYLGPYNLRRRGTSGAAKITKTENNEEISIRFDPAIRPGEQVNVVFRSFNPEAGIYQWATAFVPTGINPITSDGPTLRTSIYRNDDFR